MQIDVTSFFILWKTDLQARFNNELQSCHWPVLRPLINGEQADGFPCPSLWKLADQSNSYLCF